MSKPTYEQLAQRVRELELRDQTLQMQYQSIVDNSMDAIFLSSPDGRVFSANGAACTLFQMTQQELIDGGRLAVVDPEDPRASMAIEERAKTGKFRGEINFRKKDGTIFPGEISSSIFTDANGRTLTSWIVRDISRRKHVEKKLKSSQLWLRCIFHSLEQAVVAATTDSGMINVNRAAEKMFGYSTRELIGRSTEILHVDHDHYEEFESRVSKAFRRGGRASFKFKVKRKNGQIFPSAHSVSLLKDENGTAMGIVSVIRDISRTQKREKERKLLTAELHEAMEKVNQLSGLLLICSICKKVRDDQGYWTQIENYISDRSEASFSHGICPGCAKKHYPHLDLYQDK